MRILMTGASGDVGTRLRPLLKPHCSALILSDRVPPKDLRPDETFVHADLTDRAAVERAVAGVDGIVHFGGFSVEGPWEAILNANIIGTYHLFEAARRAGVKRIVFASSNHAVGFHPRDQTIDDSAQIRPDSLYGVSKAYGEALGALYAMKHGIGVLSIRIGNVGDQPLDQRRLAIWLKPDDLVQLIRIGLERPDLVYEVVYGMSDNARAWWDNSRATELGYRPVGRSEDHVAAALAAQATIAPDTIADALQGGPFCSDGYTAPAGHLAKILAG